MSNATRRFTRLLVLALVAASLSGCCFCGHYGHWAHGYGFSSWGGHCYAPVRGCR